MPSRPASKHSEQFGGGQRCPLPSDRGGLEKKVAVEHSTGAAHSGHQRHAGALEECAQRLAGLRGQLLHDGVEAARNVGAVVGVADRGVQFSQVGFVLI
jgi:hypothetical protein